MTGIGDRSPIPQQKPFFVLGTNLQENWRPPSFFRQVFQNRFQIFMNPRFQEKSQLAGATSGNTVITSLTTYKGLTTFDR